MPQKEKGSEKKKLSVEDRHEELRELMTEQLMSGRMMQSILDLTDSEMGRLYGAARSLLNDEDFERAADGFLFLTTLNPLIHEYWLGLGLAEQAQKNYKEALSAYMMAMLTDPSDPVTHYYSAKCFYEKNDIQNAEAALQLALKNSQGTEHEDLKKMSEESLYFLERLKGK